MARLTKQQVVNIIGRAPAGTSPEGVVASLREQGHELEGYGATAPAARQPAGVDWRRRALATLPVIGGGVGGGLGAAAGATAGGIGAIPGAAAGAGLGGASGKVAENLLLQAVGLDRPKPIGQTMRETAAEGLMQGGLQLAGGAAAGQAARWGRPLMEAAVGAPRGLRREFPKLAETIFRERIPVGKEAAAIASARRSQSAGEAAKLIRNATKAGVRLNIEEIALPAIQLEEAAIGRPLSWINRQAVVNRVMERMKELVGRERFVTQVKLGKVISPERAQHAKRIAQQTAKGARRAQALGQTVLDDPRLDDAIAKGTRAALESHVGGLAAANVRTQELIGLQRAMEEAALNKSNVPLTLFGPIRPFGSLTPYLMLPRPVVSRAGQAFTAPATQDILRQSPRAIEALIEQLVLDELRAQPGAVQPRRTER